MNGIEANANICRDNLIGHVRVLGRSSGWIARRKPLFRDYSYRLRVLPDAQTHLVENGMIDDI
jgi:hypothetical protein